LVQEIPSMSELSQVTVKTEDDADIRKAASLYKHLSGQDDSPAKIT